MVSCGMLKAATKLADAVELAAQVVGHALARRLVFGVNLFARAQALVKGDGEVFRLIMLDDVQQGAAEAINRAGALAA